MGGGGHGTAALLLLKSASLLYSLVERIGLFCDNAGYLEITMKVFDNPDFRPRLRPDLEFIPVQYQGKPVWIVRDSLGLISKSLVLPEETIAVLRLIDGKKNVRDLQLQLIRLNNGDFIGSEVVSDLLTNLDSSFLLESDLYRQEKEKIVKGFIQEKTRKPYLAGKSYPNSEKELRDYLDSCFSLSEKKKLKGTAEPVRALISPHIDYEIGKKVYVEAYSSVRGMNPKKILLLGVGHSLDNHLLSLTDKDFNTPFGTVYTDKKYIESLRKAGQEIIAPDDFAHRSEHSIEFQLIFLQYLFGNTFSIIPVLFGSFHRLLSSFSRPADIPSLKECLCVLKNLWEKESSETLIVAGVDFSHIGPKFGHVQSAASMLAETELQDKCLMDAICRNDVKGFWKQTQKNVGRFNVCGFSALSCLLEIVPNARGEVLSYDLWQEEVTRSAVSFAAMVLYKP